MSNHVKTSPKRRRGRPPISAQEEIAFLQDCYLEIETVRAEKFRAANKLRPIKEACRLSDKRGGLVWFGRDPQKTDTSEKNHGYEVESLNGKWHFRRSENGPIFVRRLVQGAKTIEARYHEAARLAKRDPNVKLAWDNMVRDRIGLPRFPPPRPLPSAHYPNALVRVW